MNIHPLISFLIVLVSATLAVSQRPNARRVAKKKIGIQSVECSADPAIANDTLCQFSTLKNAALLSFGFTVLKVQHEFSVQIQQFQEGSNKIYHPVGINIEVKACEALTDPNKTLLKVLEYTMPNYQKWMKDAMHPCPYYPGRVEVLNITILDSYYESLFFKGNIKTVTKLFNGKNQALFELKVYTFNG